MANRDAPFGAIPRSSLVGKNNGQVERLYVPSSDGTDIFVGDFVKSAGSADADGVASVTQAAAGDAILGVVVGVEVDPTNLERTYRAASTEAYVYVDTNPQQVYEIQEDADGGALAAADVGQNVDIVVGSGDTVTGRSGMEADSSTILAGSGQLRVIGFVQREDNEIGANAKLLVKINEHEREQASGV